ncbi:MAG: prepilin-type N-terminal cleavage/methylation domain-containing protein [Candidatus Omnitrophota bacterium]
MNFKKCLEAPLREKNKKILAFTLMELVIVIVIIGILSAIAIPNYNAAREKSFDSEARSALRIIRAANQQYFSQTTNYYPSSGVVSSLPTINNILTIDISPGRWTYSIERLGTGGFRVRASRSGRTWEVTDIQNEPTCFPGASCY